MAVFEELAHSYVNLEKILDILNGEYSISKGGIQFIKLLIATSVRKGTLTFEITDAELVDIAKEISADSQISIATIKRKRTEFRRYAESSSAFAFVDVVQSPYYTKYDLSGLATAVNSAILQTRKKLGRNRDSDVLINPLIRNEFKGNLIEAVKNLPKPIYDESPQTIGKRRLI
jgi:hypothetical protein